MDIKYKIEFFSEWHCSSGLAAGANIDTLVIKDKNGLPFIPGKTLKGLLREAVEDLASLQNKDKSKLIKNVFGCSDDQKDEAVKGSVFFTNAELPEHQKKIITENKLTKYLYNTVSGTAMENGVAKPHSLRRIETVVPCTLTAQILDVQEDIKEDIILGLKYIKRLGQNRNRGLGRCKIEIVF